MKTQSKKSRFRQIQGKCALLFAGLFLHAGFSAGQQAYDNFEGNSVVCYNVQRASQLDTVAVNPAPDKVNPSGYCAKYVRGRLRYDNIKICPKGKLASVENYATYEGEPPKIKMKVFTTAPVGSMVEIQLGKKEGNPYPEAIHSQFQAFTTVTGAWEELEFRFAVTPKGSETSVKNINQVTVLFNPNTNSTDTWYFDDITGPPIPDRRTVKSHKQ
jgi:hypothetical protein